MCFRLLYYSVVWAKQGTNQPLNNSIDHLLSSSPIHVIYTTFNSSSCNLKALFSFKGSHYLVSNQCLPPKKGGKSSY